MKTVIEMAREAGLLTIGTADGSEAVYTWPKGITEEIERFAELVRADERERIYFQTSSDFVKAAIADEREACAKVCEDLPAPERMSLDSESFYECVTLDCADAIRARSNT